MMQVLDKTRRGSSVFIVCVLLTIFCVPSGTCLADKGGWHLSTKPVTLTESGQRAIIGWGGETEILCLATDVSSSEKTTVIEFLPLPSEPNVTLGSRKTFEAAEKLLARRGVKLTMPVAAGPGPQVESEPFHITFHERLGAHDITVVKVNRPDEFADWVQEKAKALTEGKVSLPDSIRKLIAKYLNEYHCPYFVFDVIEVGPEPQSVEPVIYEFKSSEVFYPLEISSTFHGKTTIDLVVFSRYLVDQRPFQERHFLLSNFVEVNASDMQEVLPRLKQLLGKSAFLQTFRYTGRINRLRGNITAGPTKEYIGITRERYEMGRRWSFNSDIIGGVFGGVLIGFVSLCPMYFAAKSQKPRWLLRFLLGFLTVMPLAFGLVFGGAYIMSMLRILEYFPGKFVMFIMFSMGMGFIIFCFQFGLRRCWFLWWLVYAALAIPAAYLTHPDRGRILFQGLPLVRLWDKLKYNFIAYLVVFITLFLIARFVVWITGPRKSPRGSLSG